MQPPKTGYSLNARGGGSRLRTSPTCTFSTNTLIAAPAAVADWLTPWNSTYQGMPRRRSKTFPSRRMGRFPRLLAILGKHHCQSLAECQVAPAVGNGLQ